MRLIYAALALSIFVSSCGRKITVGRGESTAEPRNVGSFSKINISAPLVAEIHIREGAAPSLQLSGYKNILQEIKSQVIGKTLRIYTNDHVSLDTDKDIVAEITVPSLDAIEINGSGDVNTTGVLKSKDFLLEINGAGNVVISEIMADKFTADISGAGDISVNKGVAGIASYSISGAGSVKAYGVQSNDVSATVSGAGDMQVTALKTLDGEVNGAGTIHYKGTPVLKSKTSGLGEIVAAQ